MSAEENTRLARSAYEALGRGDVSGFAEVMADDIEWVEPGKPEDNPNAGTFNGRDAVMGWFAGLGSSIEITRFEPRGFIAQDDTVVALVHTEGRVRATGSPLVNDEAHVWTFRDGKLARLQIYLDTAAVGVAFRAESTGS